jgi:hypothetical protein
VSDQPPFGNAWEYIVWDDNNCGRCAKDACDIKDAYLLGSVSEPIPDGINERAGYQGHPRWWCKEGIPKASTP